MKCQSPRSDEGNIDDEPVSSSVDGTLESTNSTTIRTVDQCTKPDAVDSDSSVVRSHETPEVGISDSDSNDNESVSLSKATKKQSKSSAKKPKSQKRDTSKSKKVKKGKKEPLTTYDS